MAVKIRLTRMGKKKQPTYRVVVVDSRKPRDGAYIEQIGRYDARQEPSLIEIDNERALHWLRTGAQPTDRARKLLEISGAWTRFRIDKGDIHTIPQAPAAPPAPAKPEIHVVEHTEPEDAAETVAEEAVEAARTDAPSVEATAADAAAGEAAAGEAAAGEPAVDDAASGEAEATEEDA